MLIGVLKHYSMMYYGTTDVTKAAGMIEVSDDDDVRSDDEVAADAVLGEINVGIRPSTSF